jgi:hypothetical protein
MVIAFKLRIKVFVQLSVGSADKINFAEIPNLSAPIIIEPTSMDGVYIVETRWFADGAEVFLKYTMQKLLLMLAL